MESGPAVFAGAVFALFGGGLGAWTASRLHAGRPVVSSSTGVRPVTSAALAGVAALGALAAGAWCFTQL